MENTCIEDPGVATRHWWIRVDWWRADGRRQRRESSGGVLIAIRELINEYERDPTRARKSDVTTGDDVSLR